MQINRSDVIWNYAATFLKIAASSLLLPFILKQMPSETVGVWTVFVTVNALNSIFDFGFNPSFTRNITYIFSGVQKLEREGFSEIEKGENISPDYGLLKGVIHSMQWFYMRTAALYFFLLSTLGTWYIYIILKNYHYNHTEVYVAWGLLCSINSFNLFTIYYDSLLQGKGLVKVSKQIVIISQLVYLFIAAILIMVGKGLIAIVAAQASSVIIVRILSHRIFFTPELKRLMSNAVARSKKEIINVVYPNAVKIGLTTLGGILVQRSALIIGSLYLTLDEIASYGVTMQIVSLIAGLAAIYTNTYLPKLVQLRVKNDYAAIGLIYIKGQFVLLATYFIGGGLLFSFGSWILHLIGSKTDMMPPLLVCFAVVLSFGQTNLSVAASILSTKNIVPFFKASLISGVVIILGLFLYFHFFKPQLLGLLLVPFLVDWSYQAWKWPADVMKDLELSFTDYLKPFKFKH
jgi:O-antigen/teichoic acid export membrane protein